jgi:hypothetical protein
VKPPAPQPVNSVDSRPTSRISYQGDEQLPVIYWRSAHLNVRPWVYWPYAKEGQLLLEISPFLTTDDPLEDQAEGRGDGFYVVNTNWANDPTDNTDMPTQKKVAAYFAPWKNEIECLRRGDHASSTDPALA